MNITIEQTACKAWHPLGNFLQLLQQHLKPQRTFHESHCYNQIYEVPLKFLCHHATLQRNFIVIIKFMRCPFVVSSAAVTMYGGLNVNCSHSPKTIGGIYSLTGLLDWTTGLDYWTLGHTHVLCLNLLYLKI